MTRFLVYLILFSIAFTSCQKGDTDPPVPDDNWESFGLENIQIEKIKFSENYIFAATHDGIYRNQRQNASADGWQRIGLDSKEVSDLVVFNDQEILAAIELDMDEDISLYKTTDGGENWLPFQQGFGGEASQTVKALEYDRENPDVLFARGNFVVAKSTDRGQSWEPVIGEWDAAGYQAPLIKIDQNYPDYVWAGGENSIFQPYLNKSTNRGETWIGVNPPYEGDNAVYSLVSHPDNPEHILVGMEGQILYSTDGGENYETSIFFEDGTYILNLEKQDAQQETVYATGSQGGTSGGNLFFYESNDFGQNWELHEYDQDLGATYSNDVAIQASGNTLILYFATGDGVYRFIRR